MQSDCGKTFPICNFSSQAFSFTSELMFRYFILLGFVGTLGSGFAAEEKAVDPQTAIAIEALSRLKGIDLKANPGVKGAVLRVLDKTKGTPQFVELVRDFKITGQSDALLDYALAHPSESASADAVRLIVADEHKDLLAKTLQTTNAAAAVQVIGNSNEKELLPLIEETVADPKTDSNARRAAVRALAKSQDGGAYLVKLAKEDKLPADVRLLAGSELNLAPWPQIKAQAAEILPLPQSQNAEPLPPIRE